MEGIINLVPLLALVSAVILIISYSFRTCIILEHISQNKFNNFVYSPVVKFRKSIHYANRMTRAKGQLVLVLLARLTQRHSLSLFFSLCLRCFFVVVSNALRAKENSRALINIQVRCSPVFSSPSHSFHLHCARSFVI